MLVICLIVLLAVSASAQRTDWFYQQRAYPHPTIPENALRNALGERALLESSVSSMGAIQRERFSLAGAGPAAGAPSAVAPTAAWTVLGPNGINSPEGPVSGRITAVVTDSRNPDHIYIAAAGGGVWRSTDAGSTWQSLGDNLLSLSSGALVLDDRTGAIYYGTGDVSSNAYGAGVLRSNDGATWQQLSAQFNLGTTFRLALHPQDPRTLFVARSSGVWRSTDGGDSWQRLLSGFATDLAVDPNDPRVAFAALGRINGAQENGVYRSLDGGTTWSLLSGLPSGPGVGRVSLAESAANPAVVYAVVSRSSNFSLEGVYRSDDFGGNWRRLSSAPSNLFLSGNSHQGYFDNVIVVDPRTPDRVYLGGVELYRSTDGGNSWTLLSLRGGQRLIHEDMFGVAFRPNNPDTVYVGSEGGIYRSGDGGNTWTSLTRGLAITQFNNVALSPGGGTTFLGGTQDNGVIRLSGDSPAWDLVLRGDGGAVIFDPLNPSNVFAVQPALPARSTDGGSSWKYVVQGIPATDRSAFFPPLVMDAGNPRQLLFGTFRAFRTRDGGDSWTAISADLTAGGFLTALGIAPGTNRYYAGTSDGRVSFSPDGGQTWRQGTGIPNRWISSIAADSRAPLVAYFTASGFGSGHVFRTTDGGATWSDVTGNLPDAPASALVLDPRGPVYVATDVGVFRSEDGSPPWYSFNLGLPNSFVTALALDSGSNTLVAGTYGRGAFAVALRPPQTGPQLWAGGVANAASFTPVLAPGAIASIFGARLATDTVASATVPLPTALANATVTLNGVPAPLFFASPGQINFQVPFEITSASATLVVTTPEGSSAILVQVAPAAPGVFAGSIFHAGNGRAVDSNNPATAGEALIIYATGLGAASPAVATGAPAPFTPVAQTALPSVSIGGAAANVLFSGLTPGLVGLNQLNVTVPPGVTGDLPLVVTAGGRSSNGVTISVR